MLILKIECFQGLNGKASDQEVPPKTIFYYGLVNRLKKKPDLFIADNYQQLKTRNASIQIATCQLSELNKKDLSQKNQEIILCIDKDSDEYLIEFLDMHLKNRTDLENVIRSFRKYNQSRQKFFLLAS